MRFPSRRRKPSRIYILAVISFNWSADLSVDLIKIVLTRATLLLAIVSDLIFKLDVPSPLWLEALGMYNRKKNYCFRIM